MTCRPLSSDTREMTPKVRIAMMKAFSILSAALLCMGLAMTLDLQAETEPNNGLWMMKASQGVLGSKDSPYRWWLDAHLRYSDDANDFEQSIFRPGLGYALPNNHTLWAGYGWIANSPEMGDTFHEHRFWQQHSWKTKVGSFGLASRSRLEQRFREGSQDDAGWRFRQFIKLTRPILDDGPFYWSLWDEVFLNLNDTDWGAESGLDRNRIFAGIGWQPKSMPYLKAEVGYLNQLIDRPTGINRMDHLLSLNVFLNF